MTRLLHFRRDGLTFDVRDEGPLDGDPIVLLHGFPERATSWREVAPLLHARALRTYAPDQRGYSPGARPPRRRDYRAQELVDDVVALVDTIGRPVDLVGHDLGAAVGWVLATQRPDLVRSFTSVSVPHPSAFVRALPTSTQLLRSWYVAAFQLPVVPERVAAVRGFEPSLRRSGMTDDDVERFRREMVDDGALHHALMWYRAIPLTDPRRGAGVIHVPTTFVWSDGDSAVSRAACSRTQRYVDAPYRYVELNGVSHWIPTHAPRALADAILDRVGPVATP
jgi:pimeloyl-ACP methyl ester carboxylesterase